MIEPWKLSYPFPGAQSRVTLPMDADAFRPIAWDSCGMCTMGTDEYYPFRFNPEATALGPGDLAIIISGAPPITLVTTITAVGNWFMDLNVAPFAQDHFCCLAKFGVGALHTRLSLAELLAERDVAKFTFRHNKLWTSAPFAHFNRDETGDIYCIAP